EGCLKWQQSGLNDPAIVRKATGDYKEEMDILGPFMFECCFKRDDVQLEAKQLYETYANWCFRNGEHQLKNRAFYRILETQGFKRERGNRNKYYIKGVTLIDRNNTDKQSKLLENEENSENVTKSNKFKIS
ncbi:primase-like DNA-binding domain-containing protein, partial [Bacillus cereus]|nr:primase-like DNA-binding domain-containing protein [Bacillus cereus]